MSLFIFIHYRISMAFLLAFLVIFLRLRHRPLGTALIVAACFAATAGLDALSLYVLTPGRMIPAITIFEVVIVQMCAFALSSYQDFRTLFTGITASTYVLAGNVLCSVVYLASSHNLFLSLLVQAAVNTLFLLHLTLKMRRDYLDSMESLSVNWAKLCLIPTLVYLAIYSITVWPSNIYQTPANATGTVLFLGLMSADYILMFSNLHRMQREAEMENNMSFLETYAGSLKREAELQREADMQMAVLRHDSRHRASLISAYLDAGDLDKIRELLKEINSSLDTLRPDHYCENVAINGILANEARIAAQHQIDFRCQAVVPAGLNINEFEFAAVIANLTENAVLAAEQLPSDRERYVQVSIRQIATQLLVEISNPYAGVVAFSRETGLPLSEKGKNHGYGLRSVQSFAKKNHAIFSYEAEKGVFSVRMLLNF